MTGKKRGSSIIYFFYVIIIIMIVIYWPWILLLLFLLYLPKFIPELKQKLNHKPNAAKPPFVPYFDLTSPPIKLESQEGPGQDDCGYKY